MKHAIQCCAFFVLGCALCGCGTLNHPDDPWWGRDKAKHFGAGAALGAATVFIADRQGAGDGEEIVIGVTVGMAFGAGKEYYDDNVKGTYWNGKDFLWSVLGALTGSVAASLATE